MFGFGSRVWVACDLCDLCCFWILRVRPVGLDCTVSGFCVGVVCVWLCLGDLLGSGISGFPGTSDGLVLSLVWFGVLQVCLGFWFYVGLV